MFSGCLSQSKESSTKLLSHNRLANLPQAVFLLRHLSTTHVNDRKTYKTTGDVEAGPDTPSLSLQAWSEPRLDLSASTIKPRLLPDFTFDNEELYKEASKAPRPKQFSKWESERGRRRYINRQIHLKSDRSYDWKRPLKILKAHYKATSIDKATSLEPQSHEPLILKSLVKAKSNTVTDRIVEPDCWTKAFFDRYVYDLTRFTPPTIRDDRHRFNGTAKILHDLFQRREMFQFIEPRICNIAIEYLTRQGMLSQARSIFAVMEHLSLPIPVSTMNHFLQAAAHQGNLHVFSLLLDGMIERGLAPNTQTWVFFVQCLHSVQVKTLIVSEMARLGILHQPFITAQVLAATIKDDLADFLEDKKQPRDFLYRMRIWYGPDWMSRRAGNLILSEVCRRVSIFAGLDLIEPMKQQGFSPNHRTLRVLLFQTLTAVQDPIPLAAHILDIFENQHAVRPDRHREIWQRLFNKAWEFRYLNVIRVIWLAACVDGSATHDMQAKILYSLRVSALHDQPANDPSESTESLESPPEPSDDPSESTESPRKPAGDPSESAEDPSESDEDAYEAPSNSPPQHRTPLPRPSTRVFRSLMGKFVIGLDPLKPAKMGVGYRAMQDCLLKAKIATLKGSLAHNLCEAYKIDRYWNISKGEDVAKKLEYRWPVLLSSYDRPPKSFKTIGSV